MKDEELLSELRAAARRADEKPTGTSLDAPLGDAFEASVAARIVAARARPIAKVQDAKVRNLRPRVAILAPFAALAAAAALVLLIGRPWSHASAELPAYALAVTGGLDTERSAEPAARSSIAARADAPVSVLLRPATDVRDPLVVRVFASRGGPMHDVSAPVRTSPTGSIEVRGRLGALVGDAPGAASLVVVIARDGAGVDARAVASSDAAAPAGVARARVEVQVLP